MATASAPRARVLCVEDDELLRRGLRRCFPGQMDVRVVATVDEALQILGAWRPDVVVADLDLQDPEGRDGLWLIRQSGLPGLVVTGSHRSIHGAPVLRKPAAPQALVAAVVELLERRGQ